MKIVPVYWNFEQKEILPLIEITGESPALEGEGCMLEYSVELIKKAAEFKGFPVPTQPDQKKQAEMMLMLRFALFFPGQKEAAEFMDYIRQT